MMDMHNQRFIEHGFPCHQVGAETPREQSAAVHPPINRLHVWWARRSLTPSRAAILASLLPADANTAWFLCELGIEKSVVEINDRYWTLDPSDNMLTKRIEKIGDEAFLIVDDTVLQRMKKENQFRESNCALIQRIVTAEPHLKEHSAICRWQHESAPLIEPFPNVGTRLQVHKVPGDPAWFKDLMAIAKLVEVRVPNLYGYDRAYTHHPTLTSTPKTVLDPTAGGGSIPFEAMRLGHRVIANELNPVATVILYATLDYPARFGLSLADDIQKWGQYLIDHLDRNLDEVFLRVGRLSEAEKTSLRQHLHQHPELIDHFDQEEVTTYLFARQVTCPHCGGKAPLLNNCWLAKEREQWGVAIIPDLQTRDVRFTAYRVKQGKGAQGEDPELATVADGVGTCSHCKQAIPEDEIKRQARSESEFGTWTDRLYCVVAVRYQPKLDSNGQIQRYKSGEIKTEKVTFFRPPNARDLEALEEAKRRLDAKWDEWDAAGLIPTEEIPPNSNYNRGHRLYGIMRWCDMFTPRQLLGHLTLVEELNRLKPQILEDLGEERSRAVVTYLQFAIDKGVDYNSTYTRWIPQRGSISGTFGQHNFSMRWTFGEMIFAGPNSGFAWGLSQIVDALAAITELVAPLHRQAIARHPSCLILNRTAAYLPEVESSSVDLVCIDPPYYDNVMYAELSDFYYVWHRRTLKDLYPGVYVRRLTDKAEEAVSNVQRDGSQDAAKETYERLMKEIFAECRRVLKDEGIMTLMFTHKSQSAWETLTRSLIESGWNIKSAFPVESEFANSRHLMDTASAASSIFISCRKQLTESFEPATWTGFGGAGVQHRIVRAVAEALPHFHALRLNPVDEMVASYGQALRVLSEQWPVLDGDEPVSPMRAMNEASRVVAERQIGRLTQERLQVSDLQPEAAMALTLYGIYGLHELPYDEALNLSRSLNIRLDSRPAGYTVEGRIIGINQDAGSQRRSTSREAESIGYHAPLVRKGSKLRLARPEERHARRLEHPQTEWDVLHGLMMAYRHGDIPVVRAYLQQHANSRQQVILDLLHVWAAGTSDETLRKEGQTMVFGLK
jgi:putative DNA methylase